jgi:hypothetical protein
MSNYDGGMVRADLFWLSPGEGNKDRGMSMQAGRNRQEAWLAGDA